MKKVHFVQMWLGQTCVGMIQKFVPTEIENPVPERRESGDFFKQFTKLPEIPNTIKEVDDAVAKEVGVKKLSVKRAPGVEDVR